MQTKCFWCLKTALVPSFASVPTGRWDRHVIGWKIWACEACRRFLSQEIIITELEVLKQEEGRSHQDAYHWLCVDTYNQEPAGYCDGCGVFIHTDFGLHACATRKQMITVGDPENICST